MQKQAKIFTMEEVFNKSTIEPTTLTQIRDKVIFVFGVGALLRSSEIFSSRVEDIELQDDGIVINVHRKKVEAGCAIQKTWINNVFFGWNVVSNLKNTCKLFLKKGLCGGKLLLDK